MKTVGKSQPMGSQHRNPLFSETLAASHHHPGSVLCIHTLSESNGCELTGVGTPRRRVQTPIGRKTDPSMFYPHIGTGPRFKHLSHSPPELCSIIRSAECPSQKDPDPRPPLDPAWRIRCPFSKAKLDGSPPKTVLAPLLANHGRLPANWRF